MRVAFVAMETVHLRDTEGNRRLDRLAEQLAEAGHDVTVFAPAGGRATVTSSSQRTSPTTH